MTFEEWFEVQFPPVASHMELIRESYREIAWAAWGEGYNEGYDDAAADHDGECPPEFRPAQRHVPR